MVRSPIARAVLRALPIVLFVCAPFVVGAQLPYGSAPGADVYAWDEYLFIGNGDCSSGNASSNDLPSDFSCENDWKFTDWRDPSLASIDINQNPQEFYGVRGTGLNSAWEVSTGRPDVVVAVLDSGIRWEESRPNLLRKHYLNAGELPLPQQPAAGCAGVQTGNPGDTRFGGYDLNGDGFFNVVDYWNDSRTSDLNGNGAIDPEDLIRSFSDSVDDDGNGYVDDISGWDFFEGDNNPQDDVDYGHGTGEAEDSGGEAGLGGDGHCPNCMVMSMRVGDSFIADVNHFAEAVVYAVDNGASVIQEALGTLNHTSYGQSAIDYAYRSGVIVNASEADEAAGHHNWPAAYDKTMVVNSIRVGDDIAGVEPTVPRSYLFFNGCTNFGGYTFTSIPSTSCSSEATGRSSGVSGLLYSAARNAVERGAMTNYLDDLGVETGFPLSAEEAMQLWRLAADDIDFSTSCPGHEFCDDAPPGVTPAAPPDNYAITLPDSARYQTVKGWDYFTGYGRNNAARLIRFIGLEGHASVADREYVPKPGGVPDPYGEGSSPLTAQDRIPPEAHIAWPRRWHQYGYALAPTPTLRLPDDAASPDEIVVYGRAAANRVTAAGGTFDYAVEWAPHVQGAKSPAALALASSTCAQPSGELSGGPWTEVVCVTGNTAAVEGELARIDLLDLVGANLASPNPFDPVTDPTSEFQPEQFAIRLRLRVIAHPTDSADDVNNEALHQKQIDVYLAEETAVRDDLGVPIASPADPGLADVDRLNADALGRYAGGAGSPTYQDLDGDGVDEVLIYSSDGVLHAFTDVTTGAELPGWPVTTDPYPGIVAALAGDGSTPVDNAYTRGDVVGNVFGSVLLGSPAVADLDDDGELEVLAADLEGKLYAWQVDGTRRAGFPATVDYGLSRELPCAAATIPACDDYEPGGGKRDRDNMRDWGFNSPPSIGDLDPSTEGLEIVISANDSHVYAFHQDGSPVAGWPVVLRDPAKVQTMDPATRVWSYVPGSGKDDGSKAIVTPSLGDIDDDGDLEVVLGVNEEYQEPPNTDLVFDPGLFLLAQIEGPGNTRLYALHHTGTATPETAASAASVHTHDQAYVEGWPQKLAMAVVGLLPYVGAGTNSQSPLFDADADGTLEIVAASIAGPGYVLNHDGSSFLQPDGPTGNYRTLEADVFGAGATATDAPSLIGVGGLAVGSLDGGGHFSIVGPGAGLRRLLDVALWAQQLQAEDHILVWNAHTGAFEPGAPIIVNDLQFFTTPAVADVTGDGLGDAIEGTAMSDMVAVSFGGGTASAQRFFSGGWHVAGGAVGRAPLGAADLGFLQLGALTREGYLRFWPTLVLGETPVACLAQGEWPEYGHDARNTGNYHTDALRPYPVSDLLASPEPDGSVTLDFTATGDDRACGAASGYRVRVIDGHPADPLWVDGVEVLSVDTPAPLAGLPDSLSVGPFTPGPLTLLLRAVDEAGNGSAPAVAQVVVP